jgi:hypothetical protein
MSEVLEQILNIILTIGGGVIGGIIASIIFSWLTSPNLKLKVEKTQNNDTCIEFKKDSTLHIRVINDKRLGVVCSSTATECIGQMWIFYTENHGKIHYYNKDKGFVEIDDSTKLDDLASPYTLKWSNLPPSNYKRTETTTSIPCGVCENEQPGRQLDILGVKEKNSNEKYVLIQDVQQQDSRTSISKGQLRGKCSCKCLENISEDSSSDFYHMDNCLFHECYNKCSNIIHENNILRIAFEFPQNRTYYIVVEVICANAKIKTDKRYKLFLRTNNKKLIFKIKLNNDKICIYGYDKFDNDDKKIAKKIIRIFKSRNKQKE